VYQFKIAEEVNASLSGFVKFRHTERLADYCREHIQQDEEHDEDEQEDEDRSSDRIVSVDDIHVEVTDAHQEHGVPATSKVTCDVYLNDN